jgi:hypothetical protein
LNTCRKAAAAAEAVGGVRQQLGGQQEQQLVGTCAPSCYYDCNQYNVMIVMPWQADFEGKLQCEHCSAYFYVLAVAHLLRCCSRRRQTAEASCECAHHVQEGNIKGQLRL